MLHTCNKIKKKREFNFFLFLHLEDSFLSLQAAHQLLKCLLNLLEQPLRSCSTVVSSSGTSDAIVFINFFLQANPSFSKNRFSG
jgi:hypothetical protein